MIENKEKNKFFLLFSMESSWRETGVFLIFWGKIKKHLSLSEKSLSENFYFIKIFAQTASLFYKGMFPCFFFGKFSTLFSNMAKALINFRRAVLGWMTSSMKPRCAAR
mgnify:CR=1 FL=1